MSERERDPRMIAADAARLKNDPALWDVLNDLEAHATRVAITEFEPQTRERGRTMALAIHTLRVELQDRIDTVLMLEHSRTRATASE